jgi:hypothetical protein
MKVVVTVEKDTHHPRSPEMNKLSLIAVATLAISAITAAGCVYENEMTRPDRPEIVRTREVLTLLPANASGAVIVPSAADFAAHFRAFGEAVGLDEEAIVSVEEVTRHRAGMSETGTAMLSLPNLSAVMSGDMQDGLFLFVPVDDYATFVASMNGTLSADAAGTPDHVQLDDGSTWSARPLDDYALLGPNDASVTAYVPGGQELLAGDLVRDVLFESDISVLLDLEQMGPVVLPLMDTSFGMIESMMAEGSVDPEVEDHMELGQAMLRLYRDGLAAFMRDSTATAWGIELDGEQITLTGATQFREGSALAAMFPGGGSSADLLSMLPDREFLMVFASNMRGLDMSPVIDAVTAALPESEMGQMIGNSFELLAGIHGMASAAYIAEALPSPDESGAPWDLLSITEVDDSAAYLDLTEVVMAQQAEMTYPVMTYAEDGSVQTAETVMNIQYERNALEIDGYRVDRYSVHTEMPPGAVEDNALGRMLQAISGWTTDSSGLLVAAEGRLLNTTNSDEEQIGDVLDLDPDDSLLANPRIRSVRQAGAWLDPMAEMYIDTARIVETMQLYGADDGDTPTFETSTDVALIAGFSFVHQEAIGARLTIPVEAIQLLQQVILE